MLSQSINLSSDGTAHEPTCPICSSQIRTEAEELWEKTCSNRDVIKLFRERISKKISADVVKNHMKNHKDGGVRELKKVEFIDRTRRLYGNGEVTTLDKLNFAMAVVTDQIMEINSLEASGTISLADLKKLKSSETNKLLATFANLSKLQATIQGEMRDNGEIISIPTDRFIRVFNDAFANSESEKETELIRSILNGLRNS
jgi:hypothetical protein